MSHPLRPRRRGERGAAHPVFCSWSVPAAAAAHVFFVHRCPAPRLTPAGDRRPDRAFSLPPACAGCLPARPFRQASTRRRDCEGAIFELCENTTRPLPRQRSHPRLNSYEALHSDGSTAGARPTDAQAGGQTSRLNLHDATGPATRRDDHVITTTRRTASQLPPYPCRRLHGSSLARSGAAIPIQQTKRDAVSPTRLPDSQLQTRQDAGRSPGPTPGGPALHPRPRFARPRPPLGPPKRADCRNRQSAPTSTRRYMPPARRCLWRRLWTFPNAAIWARATRVNSCKKKLFAPHTHRSLLATRRNVPPDRHCMPKKRCEMAAMLRYRD